MNEGYFIIGLGNKYYEECKKYLLTSIKKFDTKRKICVMVLEENLSDAKKNFDDVIVYKPDLINQKYSFDVLGTIPKINIPNYTPYQKTLFLDSDCMFIKDSENLWKLLNNRNCSIILPGISDNNNSSPPDWHFGYIREVEEKCKFYIPQVSSGFIYVDKTKLIKFSETIEYFYKNYEKYGIKKLFRGSLPDEIFYAIYLGKHNIRPLDIYEYKIQQTQNTPFDQPNYDFYFYHEHSHLTIIRDKIYEEI